MSDVIILIPARYASSRFPGKPLALIHQKPMIHYVIDNCKRTGFDYAVVTDNPEIEASIKSIDGNVVRVDDEVSTGSERIHLAFDRYFSDKGYQYIVNVQGDEPLLNADTLTEIVESHKKSSFDIYTAVKARYSTDKDFNNPNIVKCIYTETNNKCLYFSRASIPFHRDGAEFEWYQHIGVYSYKVDALNTFVKTSEGYYEHCEKLEQLRAMENGLELGAILCELNLVGVDTPDDISKVEGLLSE